MNTTIHTLQIGMGWFPQQPGGLNRMYFHLAQTLPTVGVGVRGLVAGRPVIDGPPDAHVTAFAPPDSPLPMRCLRARNAARAALRTLKTDLIASHFSLYAAPLGPLLRDHPLVVHFHGPWAHEGIVEGDRPWITRLKARIERFVYDRAVLFIVLSKAFQDVLHRTFGVDPDRVRIVPGGVDMERMGTDATQAEARERLGWPSDRPVVLAVRRLQRRMGLESLVDAMAAVRDQVPEALLLLAGAGPLASTLGARIEESGLQANIRLLGFLPEADLPLAYRAADLTIVPTHTLEGFGLITIESLAAGTPVLVTPVGGLPEAVRDLSPDLVLGGHDTGSLAQGLARVLLGRLPLPDAAACRRFAQQHYAWPVIARRIRTVYEEALG